METLTLRAHHINSAKLLFQTPKEQIIDEMKRFGYIENNTNSFINIVYSNLYEYFQRLSNKLKLTVEGLDVICENCIKLQKGICNPNNKEEYYPFLSGSSFGKGADIQILEKYNLQDGKIYTVGELRKKLDF